MKFISLSLASLASLAALVNAAPGTAGTEFGLLVLRSATPVHLSSLSYVNNELVIAQSPEYFTGVWTSDGHVKINGTELYLAVDDKHNLVGAKTGSVFDIVDDYYFATNGSEAFTAVQATSSWSIFVGSVDTTSTSYPIALRVITNTASSSAAVSTTSAPATATSSVAVVTSTAAANTTTGAAQVNGASSYGLNAAAAAAAIVGGALFL